MSGFPVYQAQPERSRQIRNALDSFTPGHCLRSFGGYDSPFTNTWFALVTDRSHLPDDAPVNREELRARLQKMTNNELRVFGRAARKMCSPEVNRDKLPREEAVIELQEARAEWKRRFKQPPGHRGRTKNGTSL